MITRTHHAWLKTVATTGIASMAVLTMAGCATSGPEEGADVEEIVDESIDEVPAGEEAPAGEETDGIYDGFYDGDFYDVYDSYVGETVTVSADVNEIVSPESFTIAGTDETTVDPLLIVHDGSTTEIAEGLTIKVTGVVHREFDLPTVEEEMDLDLQDDGLYADWQGTNYITATSIDTSVATDE